MRRRCSPPRSPTAQLTLANLSQIYRIISLARAVGSSLTELLRILPLTSAGTLAAALADPAATLAFIDEVEQTRQSGFSADALVYVLTTSADHCRDHRRADR